MLPYKAQTPMVFTTSVAQVDSSWVVTVMYGPESTGATTSSEYTFPSEATAAAFAAATLYSAPAAAEWFIGSKEILRSLEVLMTQATGLERMYVDNKIFPMIQALMAATSGAIVPGAGVNFMRFLEIGAVFQDVRAHLDDEIAGVPPSGLFTGVTRRSVIGRRD
ncbi:MAG: hypothetical protein WCI67_15950 [Chloroflexales bacterium]